MDFLRTIVVDSLSLPVSTSTSIVPSAVGGGGNVGLSVSSSGHHSISQPIVDVVLDACPPDSSSYEQQCQFQTEILSSVMDYLSSAGTIIGTRTIKGCLECAAHFIFSRRAKRFGRPTAGRKRPARGSQRFLPGWTPGGQTLAGRSSPRSAASV